MKTTACEAHHTLSQQIKFQYFSHCWQCCFSTSVTVSSVVLVFQSLSVVLFQYFSHSQQCCFSRVKYFQQNCFSGNFVPSVLEIDTRNIICHLSVNLIHGDLQANIYDICFPTAVKHLSYMVFSSYTVGITTVTNITSQLYCFLCV